MWSPARQKSSLAKLDLNQSFRPQNMRMLNTTISLRYNTSGLIMTLLHTFIKVPALFLLLILFGLPVYGPGYFSAHAETAGTHHGGFVCNHDGKSTDSGHESPENDRHVTHCHELDAPCITSSVPLLEYSPVISPLMSSLNSILLDGYAPPFDIPPEQRMSAQFSYLHDRQ